MVQFLLCRCFERLGLELAILLQKDFDLALGFLQLLTAVVGKLDSFLEQFKSLFEGYVPTLEFIDDFFQPLQAIFELGQCPILIADSTPIR